MVGWSESSMVSRRNQSLSLSALFYHQNQGSSLLRKNISSNKAGKKVIGPNQSAGANDEKLSLVSQYSPQCCE